MNVDTPVSVNHQERRFRVPITVLALSFVAVCLAVVRALDFPITALVLIMAAVILMWTAVRHPMICTGVVLACMPVFPLAFLFGKFFGPGYVASLAGCDRVALLLLVIVLWQRNGIELRLPDYLLLICFSLASLRFAFGGMPIALLSDFSFAIAYAAGRVAKMAVDEETLWAKRAIWIVAILSVSGLLEVFVFGEGPRTLLYLAVADGATEGGGLAATFHAEGFTGLRESSTMFGPIQFASLCMVVLILWWVYSRKPLPGIMLATGLVCSLTRSAWLGTALAIPLLALVMNKAKHLVLCAVVGGALFAAFVPFLGISEYLFLSKTGQDFSTQGHQESVVKGVEYVAKHPLGVGPGNAGSYATRTDSNGIFVENTYLTLAAEYGIAAALAFVGFMCSAFVIAWRDKTLIGYSALGILAGFGVVMMIAPLHQDFSLASWIWFPVGIAVSPRKEIERTYA